MRAGPAPWVLGAVCCWMFVGEIPALGTEPSVRIGPISIYDHSDRGEKVALGQDLEVPAGTTVRTVVVVAGDAKIDGEVTGEVVVVLGGVKLGPQAKIGRELVMIGGPLEEAEGAVVARKRVLISWGSGWAGLNWLRDWVRDGLFMARPLPHQHRWAWLVAAVFLLAYLMLAAVLPRSVERCREALQAQPGAAFVLGLLGFLLVTPLLLLLAVSVVGVLVIPFFVIGLIFAVWLGKASLYQFAGCQLGSQLGVRFFALPLGGLLLGGAAFSFLYAVPLLGALVWGLAAITGLGAVVLVLFGGRSEAAEGQPIAAAPSPGPPAAAAALSPSGALVRAGFWIRFWATLLDALMVGTLLTVFDGREFAFLVWAIYHFALWTWRGTTVGGMLMGIRIVRTDGRPIDYAVALVRCVAAVFSALVLFLGFFWAGWDRRKQAWHDKIAGTIVVRVPKTSLS